MNSMSRPYDHDDKACGYKKPIEAKEDVLLKCKTGNSVLVPVPTNGIGTTVVSLTINTKKFKDPCFKFDFAANIVPTLDGTISFQITKRCKGDDEAENFGPAWTVTTVGTDPQVISFFVCDCDCECDCDKDDCCTYSVVATTTADANVNNPTLSALVVEKTIRCK